MKTLRNWSIRAKTIVAFALVLCCTVGLGLFAVDRLQSVNAAAADLRDHWLPSTRTLGNMGRAAERLRAGQGTWLLSTTKESKEQAAAAQQKALQLYKEAWSSYEQMITPPSETPLAEAVKSGWAQYAQATEELNAMIRAGEKDEAAELFSGTMFATMGVFRKALDANLDFQQKASTKAADDGATVGNSAQTWILVVLGLMATLCIAIGWSMVRSISVPITAMTGAMRRLVERDMATVIPGVGRGDEIGGMAGAVQVFKDNMVTADRLAAEQASEQVVKEQRTVRLEGLVHSFEAKVGVMVGLLASGSTELEATARSMSSTAARTNGQATTVASAAEEASMGVGTVAAAAEELSASINEISRQVSHSSKITGQAVADAQRFSRTSRAAGWPFWGWMIT